MIRRRAALSAVAIRVPVIQPESVGRQETTSSLSDTRERSSPKVGSDNSV
jgi:hypothetical protein